jgi:hypothetical protein
MSTSNRPSSPSTDTSGNTYSPPSTPTSIPTSPINHSHNIFDISYRIIDVSYNTQHVFNLSGGTLDVDCSGGIFIPTITDFSLNTIINGDGYHITHQQGFTSDGSNVTLSSFHTTDASFDTQITEELVQIVTTYDDVPDNSPNKLVLDQIKSYASQIKCEDFHGKGSIDDYTNLFNAAAKIATESKQMELDIDIEGFNEFGKAAEELTNIFNGFIMKLQNVNIISDYTFLTSIATALGKIVNLSKIFSNFKETILATTSVQIPKSAHDTKVVIAGVMDEINCAMQYINHFVDGSFNAPVESQLSNAEKTVIDKAIETIDTWNVLCEQGISVTLQHDPDIQFITQASTELINTTNVLKSASVKLKTKLAKFHYC